MCIRDRSSGSRGGDDGDDDAVAVLPKPFLRALRRWADEAQLRDRGGLRGVFARYDKAGDGSLDARKLRKLVAKAVDDVDEKVQEEKLAAAVTAKEEAVAREDYDAAKRLKRAEETLRRYGGQLAQLEASAKQAFEALL